MRPRQTRIRPSKYRQVWGVIVAVLIGATLLAGCSIGGPQASKDDGSGDKVSIKLIAFNPDALVIKTDANVTWTQEDMGATHTVTSGTVTTEATGAATAKPDGKFDSGRLESGKTFSFTFEAPGRYLYFCEVHPVTMKGEINVD